MKKESKIAFGLIIISFLIGIGFLGLSSNVKAHALDINYTFVDDILYDADSISLNDTFNLGNKTQYTGNYSATYSFESESQLDDWVDDSDGNTSVNIIDNIGGHNKVLELKDNNNTGKAVSRQHFDDLEIGFIEFWWYVSNATFSSTFQIAHTISGASIHLIVANNLLKYYDNDTHEVSNFYSNLWHHIRLDFNCILNVFNITLNMVLVKENADFRFLADYMNYIIIFTHDINDDYISCFDAIGYSWKPIYTFDKDEIGSEPEGWVSDNDDGCTTTIIESFDSRNNVLELYDNNNDGIFDIYANINQEVNQTIEFYVAKSSIALDKNFSIIFKEGDNNIFILLLQDDDLYSRNIPPLSDELIKGNFIVVNTFFKIKIVLNDTVNTFNCYINDVLESTTDYLVNTIISINNIRFVSIVSDYQYYGYIDDMDISSDNSYHINDNIIPLLNVSSELGVVFDEFAFDSEGFTTEVGDENACGWIGNNATHVKLIENDEPYDKKYEINCSDSTQIKGIQKDLIYGGLYGLYNITLNISRLTISPDSYSSLEINGSGDTSITKIGIFNEEVSYKLKYFNSTDWILLDTISSSQLLNRELILYINDYFCYLTYRDSTGLSEYYFLRINHTVNLQEISFFNYPNDLTGMITHIDKIGIYVNGTNALIDDYGIYFQNSSISWDTDVYNLVEIEAIGYFSFGYYESNVLEILRGFRDYDGFIRWNLLDDSIDLTNPTLAFVTNITISSLSIKISRIRLTDGINNYIPLNYNGNVNIDESHFYIDSSNRLQFTLIANDNDTEYIELMFLLLIKTTENRSVSFQSNINGVSEGYLHFAYWGYKTTDIFFPYYLTTTTVKLPQGYIIYALSIIISDFDTTYYDVCEGYITNLKLLYTPEGEASIKLIPIDISALIVILIPLIILLAPTFAISVKFGKKAILPMFVLMSLICVATNLIPVWLFFIIAISTGALMLQQFRSGDKE